MTTNNQSSAGENNEYSRPTGNKSSLSKQIKSADGSDFVWDEYLKECSAVSAPPILFWHVEQSLQNCISEGLKLEVPNKLNPGTYWIATVVMTCGPLLRLRYEGFEERSADFWCDVTSSDIHPIGWCKENGKNLEQPPEVKGNFVDYETIKSADTIQPNLLKSIRDSGVTPIDQIRVGMVVDILDDRVPNHVWPARILKNIGGRLFLRYFGVWSNHYDDWLFYLSYRVHHLGWGKSKQFEYKPPAVIAEQYTSDAWDEILRKCLNSASSVPGEIFQHQQVLRPHNLQTGTKLETCCLNHPDSICPATVTDILDDHYFTISRPDGEDEKRCFNAMSSDIFPINFAQRHGLKYCSCAGVEFSWTSYLEKEKSSLVLEEPILKDVQHDFEVGMMIEAVDLSNPNELSPATITKVDENFLWVCLDATEKNPEKTQIVSACSFDMFPVGWCESNAYPLQIPSSWIRLRLDLTNTPSASADQHIKQGHHAAIKAQSVKKEYSTKIYFNHRCFTGKFLSKSRLAELPQEVGPGPVVLVLREVLSKIISIAYKSSRVLRELCVSGKANPSMKQIALKAKYKGKTSRAFVEVVGTSDKVPQFCRSICEKLECCPNLFGPTLVVGGCPENCQTQTKTKYTCYYRYVKKKKRPWRLGTAVSTVVTEAVDSNKEVIPTRKLWWMKKYNDTGKKAGEADESGEDREEASSPFAASVEDDESNKNDDELTEKRKKYLKPSPVKSSIVTRGAKLPNFALKFWQRHGRHKRCPSSGSSTVSSVSESPLKRSRHPSIMAPKKILTLGTKGLDRNLCKNVMVVSKVSRATMTGMEQITSQKRSPYPQINSNPFLWTVDDVITFIKQTDCANMCKLLKDEEIDGQALLMLNLPTIQEHLCLRLEMALKLCTHVENIKLAFFRDFTK